MGEEFSVKELADAGLTVLFLLAGSEFLFQPLVAFFGGDDFVFFVVVHFVDVGDDVLERVRVPGDGLEDVLVVFHAERTHEEHDRDGGGSSGGNLHHQHAVAALLDGERLAHSVFLGEDFGNFRLLGVALVDFNRDTVGGEVFHRDEDTLGSVDDEVAAGVEGVFALLLQQFVPGGFVLGRGRRRQDTVAGDVLGVKVASLGADHDGHVADRHTGLGGGRNAVSLDGEVNGHRGHVSQLAEATFHWR